MAIPPDSVNIADIPELPCEVEVAMQQRLQQHILTTMQPYIGQVNQLVKAVESLSEDVAEEQAKSRQQHDVMSLHLKNLEETVAVHFPEFANASQDKLTQRLEHVVEQRLAEVKYLVSCVEDRLLASACDWQRTVAALCQEVHANSELLNRSTQSAADELRRDLHSNAERVARLDARFRELVPFVGAMQKTVGAMQPTLHMVMQEQFGAFDRHPTTIEEDAESMNNFGMAESNEKELLLFVAAALSCLLHAESEHA